MDSQFVEEVPIWAQCGRMYTLEKESYHYDNTNNDNNHIFVGSHITVRSDRENAILKLVEDRTYGNKLDLKLLKHNPSAISYNNILVGECVYLPSWMHENGPTIYHGYVFTLNNKSKLYDDKEPLVNKIYVGAPANMTNIRFRLLVRALATGARDEKGSRIESLDERLIHDSNDDARTTISDEDFDDLPDLVPFITSSIVSTPIGTPINTPQNDNAETIAVNNNVDLRIVIESVKQKISHLSTDYEDIKIAINNLNESVNEMLKKQVITQNDTPLDTPPPTINQASRINAIEEAIAIYQKFPGFNVRSVKNGATIVEIINNTIIIQ